MILYKPTNTIFRNRLEAKLFLGHATFNRLVHTHPEDLIFIDNNTSAIDEQLYKDSYKNNRIKE